MQRRMAMVRGAGPANGGGQAHRPPPGLRFSDSRKNQPPVWLRCTRRTPVRAKARRERPFYRLTKTEALPSTSSSRSLDVAFTATAGRIAFTAFSLVGPHPVRFGAQTLAEQIPRDLGS